MRMNKLLHTSALATFLLPLGYSPAAADFVYGGNDLVRLSGDRTVRIEANNDNNGANENVIVTVAGQTQMTIGTNGTTVYDNLYVSGFIFDGDFEDDTVNIGENLEINGATTVTTGGLNVTGATDLNTGLNVDGQTTLDATTIAGVTSVNTSGASDTTIGGALNTTFVNSRIINIGVQNDATDIGIGSNQTETNVLVEGGTSQVQLANGTTSVNTVAGAANTAIGTSGNMTSIMSTTISVGNATHATAVSIATGSAANTVAMGNAVSGTTISATAGNASSSMQNGSITDRVAANTSTVMLDGSIAGTVVDGTVSAGSVIANNGSRRMIADENGKIVVNDGTDTTTGSTASMYVTNSSGNLHGLVVQETKTTLSGGINSGSMTLDDRGATFSNPADGSPIQVHGVADGTAPFDAVNVRQLYSGLAAVLASTPEIALAPGKTGMAVGLGGYGNYGAIGIGFGHMYENGTTLKASASKGQYSELAYRASVSWNW